ncbi:unnamed protein product [Tuwongella immobilis]|uniref:Uncharacterized protein n=1 Tax=Tuwongella immobilis TaxID=692036 RepID=A0A6C2YTW6_9BACT|nr:unnamed protein product [Tuwongella immobilis]VTS07732.1 unnamed protein product [Tuwongella immobilis]
MDVNEVERLVKSSIRPQVIALLVAVMIWGFPCRKARSRAMSVRRPSSKRLNSESRTCHVKTSMIPLKSNPYLDTTGSTKRGAV